MCDDDRWSFQNLVHADACENTDKLYIITFQVKLLYDSPVIYKHSLTKNINKYWKK